MVVGVGVEGVRDVVMVVAVATVAVVAVVIVVTVVADELEEVKVGRGVVVGLVERSLKDWKVLLILNRLLRFILCGMTPAPVVRDEDEEDEDEELAPKVAVTFVEPEVDEDMREVVPEAVESVAGSNPGEDAVVLLLLLLLLESAGDVGEVGEAELEEEDLRWREKACLALRKSAEVCILRGR